MILNETIETKFFYNFKILGIILLDRCADINLVALHRFPFFSVK